MSERDFFLPSARQRGAEAIRNAEATTAAELVLAVRHEAARHYRASLAAGGLVAAVAVLVMLVSPTVYAVPLIAIDGGLAFLLGFVVSRLVPGVRRRLTTRKQRHAAATSAARRAFVEQGVARTSGRTGLLVFVALFERSAVLVADTGIPVALLGEPYRAAERALAARVEALDFDGLLAALNELGPLLARALPRTATDSNELADDVV